MQNNWIPLHFLLRRVFKGLTCDEYDGKYLFTRQLVDSESK